MLHTLKKTIPAGAVAGLFALGALAVSDAQAQQIEIHNTMSAGGSERSRPAALPGNHRRAFRRSSGRRYLSRRPARQRNRRVAVTQSRPDPDGADRRCLHG